MGREFAADALRLPGFFILALALFLKAVQGRLMGRPLQSDNTGTKPGQELAGGFNLIVDFPVPMSQEDAEAGGQGGGGVVGEAAAGFRLQFQAQFGDGQGLVGKEAAQEPILVSAQAPLAQVLGADGGALKVPGEDLLDLGEGIEPLEQFRAFLGLFEAGVEFFAEGGGEAGDLAVAGMHRGVSFGGGYCCLIQYIYSINHHGNLTTKLMQYLFLEKLSMAGPGRIYASALFYFFSSGFRVQWAAMKAKILVADDETDALELIEVNLAAAGYEVLSAVDGKVALELARTALPNLILLDIMLPEMDGLEVCKALRRDPATATIPIIMLTARATEIDRVLGLELGADDYITKPFSPRELVLRVKNVLKRTPPPPADADRIQFRDLIIDKARHHVTYRNKPLGLTATEFKLVSVLAARKDRVQSREQLLKDVWGYQSLIDTRTIDTHMRRLRDKLGGAAEYLETIRGVGYRFRDE